MAAADHATKDATNIENVFFSLFLNSMLSYGVCNREELGAGAWEGEGLRIRIAALRYQTICLIVHMSK